MVLNNFFLVYVGERIPQLKPSFQKTPILFTLPKYCVITQLGPGSSPGSIEVVEMDSLSLENGS